MPTPPTVVNLLQDNALIINILQGHTFLVPFTWKDAEGTLLDFTGYTPFAQVRTNYYVDSGQLIVSMTPTPDAGNNYVQLDDDIVGRVNVRVDQSVTETLNARQRYYLEIKLTSPGDNITIGIIARLKIKKDVARV